MPDAKTRTTLYKLMIVGCLIQGQCMGWALAGDETVTAEPETRESQTPKPDPEKTGHSNPEPLAPKQRALRAVAALQQRLQPWLHPSSSQSVWTTYQAQKAQMWLSYAASEYSERSLSRAGQQAQAEATRLIEWLEQDSASNSSHLASIHTDATTTDSTHRDTRTPVIATASRMREDLWTMASRLKQQPGFDCAPTEIAHAEVMLVWAAAEHQELGWRHSHELFAAAERLLDQANDKISHCQSTLADSTPTASTPLP